jgi:hypothetical protein
MWMILRVGAEMIMSAAEKPDPMTSSGSWVVCSGAMGASNAGGGILTVKMPEARTRCLQWIPRDPMTKPRPARRTWSALVFV